MKNVKKLVIPAAGIGLLFLLFSGKAKASTPKKTQKPKKKYVESPASRIAGLGFDYAPPADVLLLKEILGAWGYDPGPLNTAYNTQTAAAVRAFQKDNNLDETGEVDGLTPLALVGKEQRINQQRQSIAGVL